MECPPDLYLSVGAFTAIMSTIVFGLEDKYMRKLFVTLLVALACSVCLSSCGKEPAEEPFVVYSFCGENEMFSISNGVIVLSPTKEILYGGNLEGQLSDIIGYTMTFYIPAGNDERVLLSNSATDMTGGTIDIAGEIGKVSGDIFTETEIDELQNNLFFELKTTALNGEENTYQVQLVLTEITGTTDN